MKGEEAAVDGEENEKKMKQQGGVSQGWTSCEITDAYIYSKEQEKKIDEEAVKGCNEAMGRMINVRKLG